MFLQEVQVSPNGKWTPGFRNRVQTVKDKLGVPLSYLGERFEFSGSFVSGLIAGKHNMSSKYAPGVLQALQSLEVEAGITKVTEKAEAGEPTTDAIIKMLHKRGFSVELRPLAA